MANWFESYASIMELNVVGALAHVAYICPHLSAHLLSGSIRLSSQMAHYTTNPQANGPFISAIPRTVQRVS